MTLEGHIKKAEEEAERIENDPMQGVGIWFNSRSEALEYAENCKQLANWLKELEVRRTQEEERAQLVDKYIKRRIRKGLDEISMGIEQLKAGFTAKEGGNENVVNGLNCALTIIETYQDRYKPESEGEGR